MAADSATTIDTVGRRAKLRPGSPPIRDYLVGGEVPLGILADVAGAMLDALEAHFVLYDEDQVHLASTAIPDPEASARSRGGVLTP